MQRKIITTTLGELIVAVTDEVKPIIRDPSDLYDVVSCILSDLLVWQRVNIFQRSSDKYSNYLLAEVTQSENTQWPD